MSERWKIVHAVHSAGFAGVERYIATLARAQAVSGCEVTVVGGGDPKAFARMFSSTGVRYCAASTLVELTAQLERNRNADLFHVHMTAAEAATLGALRARTVPVVSTRHFAAPRGRSLFGRMAAPLIRDRIAAQIAISSYVASCIDGASEVVRSGVPDVSPNLSGRGHTFLIAQRLEPEKATGVAIAGFARSELARKGWRLRIAGGGSELATLRAQAQTSGVGDYVDFLGPRDDVGELMALSGVLLATCPVEGLGLTALEGMAAAAPVIAARAGGHLETVGIAHAPALFAPNDAVALAREMVRLAEDEDLRADYGAELHRIQRQRFTSDHQMNGTNAIYRRVLS